MTCRSPLKLAACMALSGVGNLAMASDEPAQGFAEGSTLSVLNRNFYFNRDNRDAAAPTRNPGKQPDNAIPKLGRMLSLPVSSQVSPRAP